MSMSDCFDGVIAVEFEGHAWLSVEQCPQTTPLCSPSGPGWMGTDTMISVAFAQYSVRFANIADMPYLRSVDGALC